MWPAKTLDMKSAVLLMLCWSMAHMSLTLAAQKRQRFKQLTFHCLSNSGSYVRKYSRMTVLCEMVSICMQYWPLSWLTLKLPCHVHGRVAQSFRVHRHQGTSSACRPSHFGWSLWYALAYGYGRAQVVYRLLWTLSGCQHHINQYYSVITDVHDTNSP